VLCYNSVLQRINTSTITTSTVITIHSLHFLKWLKIQTWLYPLSKTSPLSGSFTSSTLPRINSDYSLTELNFVVDKHPVYCKAGNAVWNIIQMNCNFKSLRNMQFDGSSCSAVVSIPSYRGHLWRLLRTRVENFNWFSDNNSCSMKTVTEGTIQLYWWGENLNILHSHCLCLLFHLNSQTWTSIRPAMDYSVTLELKCGGDTHKTHA
jgi:hypothetical protein